MNTRTPSRIGARRRRRADHRGFALIEAMVGILIFAFGVLGIVGLQATMTRAQTTSKFRGEAAYLASEVIGMMWSDLDKLDTYSIGGSTCTAARCVDWARKVELMLPGGSPSIEVNDRSVSVRIQWTVPGEGTHVYATSTVIHD